MIGPMLFTSVFASFIGANREWHLPGAPYLLAALLLIGAICVAWRVTRPRLTETAPGFATVAADSSS
jgi:DHA1 family tetracycline resistance protein-like MFS transporter